jgi:hypothetical protein
MMARKRPGRATRFWSLATIDDVRGSAVSGIAAPVTMPIAARKKSMRPLVSTKLRGEAPPSAIASESQMLAKVRKATVASHALLV